MLEKTKKNMEDAFNIIDSYATMCGIADEDLEDLQNSIFWNIVECMKKSIDDILYKAK